MKHLAELIELAQNKPVRRLAIAAAHDITVLQSVKKAFEEKIIIPTFIGNKNQLN